MIRVEILDKFKIPIGLSLVGTVLITGGLLLGSKKDMSPQEDFPKESLVSSQIMVDVSGAVVNPGVYKLESESRIEDAIKAAGGLAEQASGEYVSKSLNLAQKISDGVKIYIPYQGEKITGQASVGIVAGIKNSNSGGVNISSANQAELEALPGIGPVTASKIISGRPYGKVSDLLDQKIVPKTTFEKIKDSLVI